MVNNDDDDHIDGDDSPQPPSSLRTTATTSGIPTTPLRSTPPSAQSSTVANTTSASATASAKRKRPQRNNKAAADSGTSSGEERWLDAIESGKLEQVDDEMKKLKDPKLMTARQRAMYERTAAAAAHSAAAAASMHTTTPSTLAASANPMGGENITIGQANSIETAAIVNPSELYSLPTGYKEIKVLSAEDIEKAAIKSQKRRQLADEKREKNKRKTMERLLKKKDYKATAAAKMSKSTRLAVGAAVDVPMIVWRSDAQGTTITFPLGMELPLAALEASGKPPPIIAKIACQMCGEPKRYNCSRTKVPLCSFECYKLNMNKT